MFLVPIIYCAFTAAEITFTGITIATATAQIAGTLTAAWAAYELNRVQTRLEEKIKYHNGYDYSDELIRMQRGKKGEEDDTLPKDPFNHPDWEDISHPEAKERGHHDFKNKKTGETVRFDKGKPNTTGHKARDHYHRLNPERTGKKDWYLDADRNPVPDKSEASHLYPPK